MSTYLLTWNPRKWKWEDLPSRIKEIKKKGFAKTDWSCGNSKRIAEGDRVFLLRQGEEPRGICGAGWADSESYAGTHWREEKAKIGRTTRYVNVRWEVLLDAENESIFPREWLNERPLSEVNWNTQISGITVPARAAEELEERWAEFLEGRGGGFSLFSKSIDDGRA